MKDPQSNSYVIYFFIAQMEISNTNSEPTKRTSKRCIEDYEEVIHPKKFTSELGKGSYGSVKLVRAKGENDKLYAMKIVIFAISKAIILILLLDQ